MLLEHTFDDIANNASSTPQQTTAKGRYTNLIRKGDLLHPDMPIVVKKWFAFKLGDKGSKILEMALYEMPDDVNLDRHEDESRMEKPEGTSDLSGHSN